MLQIASSATNPPDVVLSGTGSAASQAQMAATPNALNFTAAAGSAAAPQELVLQSNGSAVLRIDAIRVASGSFALGTAATQACQAAPFDLMPGQSCRLAVAWSSNAAGSESGALEVDSSAHAVAMSVPLTATRETSAALASGGGMSNAGAGGCSIVGRDGAADPTLWLLVALALVVLRRRRR
jgi:MYXO-CTERM domain-containing protein